MKKTIAILLTLCFVFLFTACKGEKAEKKEENPSSSQVSSQIEKKAEKKIISDLIAPVDSELNNALEKASATNDIVACYENAINKINEVVTEYKNELTGITGTVNETADYKDAASLKVYVEKLVSDFEVSFADKVAQKEEELSQKQNAGSLDSIEISSYKYTLTKEFAEKLKAIREQQGLSQEKLAAEAGLHRTYIGMVERLERNPSLVCVHKIANGLGVDIRELF